MQGKTALVTGASRGIGLKTVQALADEGLHVVGAARHVSSELREVSPGAMAVDLTSAHGPEKLVEHAVSELGGLDFVVNNVGGGEAVQFAGFLDIDDAQWQANLDVNLFTVIRTSRAALPHLIARRGSIINVSSINARLPAPGIAAYNVAKAAVTALSKALAEEFGPQGVRVNTVSPGVVRTAPWEEPGGIGTTVAAALGLEHSEFLDQLPQQFGLTTGRITEPEEVARLIVFLLSGCAPNLIGADVAIDGGSLKTV